MNSRKTSRPWIRWLLVPGLVLLGLGAFIAFMPRGYSVNLALVGQGLPAVVQVYDDNSVRSHELMEAFNKVRGEYEGRVEFLVADLNLPAGRQFAQRYNVPGITVLFFSPNGTVVHTLSGLQEPAVLKNTLEQAFSL